MLARDDQCAVVGIVEIGIEFGDEPMARAPYRRFSCRVSDHAHERHLEHLGGVADGLRHLFRPRRHAVERAVRLDVVERHAFGLEKALQRADLIDDAVGQFFAAASSSPAGRSPAGRAARDARRH